MRVPFCSAHSRSVLLLLWISFGLYLYWLCVPLVYNSIRDAEILTHDIVDPMQLLYVVFGWMADAWIGRYKIICCGLCICFISCFFETVAIITSISIPLVSTLFSYFATFLGSIGYGFVVANVITFITDQMIGAPSDEIAAVVYWYVWATSLPQTIHNTMRCLPFHDDNSQWRIVNTCVAYFCLALAISSLLMGHHMLDKTAYITYPIRSIAKVLNYARKNRYPKSRSALTYWEESVPSRLDMGKEKYGGPFTEEEVENVKTALKVILFVILFNIIIPLPTALHIGHSHGSEAINCLLADGTTIVLYLTVLGVPLYLFIVQPLCRKISLPCNLTMLRLQSIYFICYILSTSGLLIIDTIAHLKTTNDTNHCLLDETKSSLSISYYWSLIPLAVQGVGDTIGTCITYLFIIAQSPLEMKGLMFGLAYAICGLVEITSVHLPALFRHILPVHSFPGCDFYYLLIHVVYAFIVFMLYVALSKWYKLRVRDNPVNIHAIAENHIIAYITQERNFRRRMGQSESDFDDNSDISD